MAGSEKYSPTNKPQDEALEDAMNPEASEPDVDRDATDEAVTMPPAMDEAEQLRGELEEASRRLLLAQADLENFRKRVRRDYEEQIRYAAVPLLQDILQVRDNLNRALAASASPEANSGGGLREGVAMVAKLLEDTLAKHGCHSIDALGETFDPNVHEAISQMPSAEHPAGKIAHEAVTGYRLHDRVIRPSQVIVSTGPAQG